MIFACFQVEIQLEEVKTEADPYLPDSGPYHPHSDPYIRDSDDELKGWKKLRGYRGYNPGPPKVCKVCGKIFVKSETLRNHLWKVHEILVKPKSRLETK